MTRAPSIRALPAIVTGLLALTVAAHVWAASTPLPFGGPNVWAAALTVAAAGIYVIAMKITARPTKPSFRRRPESRGVWALVVTIFIRLYDHAKAIVIPRRHFTLDRLTRLALAVSSCLLLWAAVSVWINDQYPSHLTRLGQTAMGIAMLWVVSATIVTLPRIRSVTAAIAASTFVSALVGIGILLWGEPFTSLRLWIMQVPESAVQAAQNIRTAGLSVATVTFSYQLAAAIPLAVGLLLVFPFRRPAERGNTSRDEWIWRGAVVALLTILTSALILNASRSAILGVFFGALAALSPLLLKRPGLPRTPNLLSLAIVAVATFALVNLIEEGGVSGRIVSVQDTSVRARLPMAITALKYAVEYPLGTVAYHPQPRHLPSGLDPVVQKEVLRHTPHNQFLVVLVYYGWPGLALLIAFYGVIASSLLSSARLALKLGTAESVVLVAAIAGCIAAYGCNSLFHNAGPFVSDWYHWIAIGLVFSIHAALKGVARNPDPNPSKGT